MRGKNIPINEPPNAIKVEFDQSIVGKVIGLVEITRPDKRFCGANRHVHVAIKCTLCGNEGWISLYNLQQGKSKGCKPCSQPKIIPMWLVQIVNQAKSRCENPDNKAYKNYGARGIRFNFPSAAEATRWILSNMEDRPHKFTLDRINNDGHYEPGNLRWASRRTQILNSRRWPR